MAFFYICIQDESETDICLQFNQEKTGPINSIKLFNSHKQMQ